MELRSEIERVAIKYIDPGKIHQIAEVIIKAVKAKKRIFLFGAGRSGIICKADEMRLAQLEIPVYFITDYNAPALKPGDIIIFASSSGETGVTALAMRDAQQIEAEKIALVSYENSTIGLAADITLFIPDLDQILAAHPEFKEEIKNLGNFAPLGTIFESLTLKALDVVIEEIMDLSGKTDDDLKRLHFNVLLSKLK